jgi:hypothetical protein
VCDVNFITSFFAD